MQEDTWHFLITGSSESVALRLSWDRWLKCSYLTQAQLVEEISLLEVYQNRIHKAERFQRILRNQSGKSVAGQQGQ